MGDFTAVFTGLCGFAPKDVEFGDPNTTVNPKAVMVLMVDAVPKDPPLKPLALDGEPLRPHAPFILFNSSDMVARGDLPKGASTQLFVNRKEISFEIDEYPTGSNPFKISQRVPASREDFSHTPHIKEVVKDSANFKLKPECFKDALSKGVISARVRLQEHGFLATQKFDSTVEFDFAKTLGGAVVQRPLADKVSIGFINVTQVRVVLRDLDAGGIEKIAFNTDGRSVNVTIANLCGDSLVPSLPTGAQRPARLSRDEDFRWLYELLDADAASLLKKKLNGLPLPIPVPVFVVGGGGLRVVQCM